MSWLSINPNTVSEEVKITCCEILYPSSKLSPEDLNARELAEAFNLVDPEFCKLSPSDNTWYGQGELDD